MKWDKTDDYSYRIVVDIKNKDFRINLWYDIYAKCWFCTFRGNPYMFGSSIQLTAKNVAQAKKEALLTLKEQSLRLGFKFKKIIERLKQKR